MRSGDGLVVRVRPPTPIVPAEMALRLADLARTYGNGRLDLTQRANLQLRGVSDETWGPLIDRLTALDLIDADAESEAIRNVVVNPLSSDDTSVVAAALRTALATDPVFRALPGKFAWVVDERDGLSLDGVEADVRFLAEGDRVAVEIGDLWRLGTINRRAIGDVAARLAATFVARTGDATAIRRMGALVAAVGAAAVAEETGFDADRVHQRAARDVPSVIGRQTDGVSGIGIPFGRLTADDLTALAHAAAETAMGDIRLTPWRAVLLTGLDDTALGRLGRAGFIIAADDPRLAVAACSGAPDCASAAADVRADALALAPLAARLPGSGIRLHVSGCAKGCARPQPTPLTLVASTTGYGLVRNGRAGDAAVSTGPSLSAIESVLQTMSADMPDGRTYQAPKSDRASYIRDGQEIYRHSFAIIRSEADLARFSASEEPVAVRIIHACGMVEVAADIVFSEGAVDAARAALRAGAPIFTDAEMVARGVTRARLPANNDVICTLTDPRVAAMATAAGTTRSAAAMELWRDRLGGSIVAIGNAPTALYRLLDMLDEGAASPACVIGIPVGFVGAAESKQALLTDGRVPAIIVTGRKGGSAMAAAAVNALASERE
jgi:precorrin-3B synthase